jgi:hypothetical protein
LPALAGVVPAYVSGVTVLVDDDDSGRKNSNELASRLKARGIDVDLLSARSV